MFHAPEVVFDPEEETWPWHEFLRNCEKETEPSLIPHLRAQAAAQLQQHPVSHSIELVLIANEDYNSNDRSATKVLDLPDLLEVEQKYGTQIRSIKHSDMVANIIGGLMVGGAVAGFFGGAIIAGELSLRGEVAEKIAAYASPYYVTHVASALGSIVGTALGGIALPHGIGCVIGLFDRREIKLQRERDDCLTQKVQDYIREHLGNKRILNADNFSRVD